MAKNDLQGTLDLLVLKTLSQTGSCTATELFCTFSERPTSCCALRKARCIRLYTAWSKVG